MEITYFGFTIIIVFLIQEICSTKETDEHVTQQLDEKSNPLANVLINESEIGDVNRNGNHTKDSSLRVKRQFYYDPYYRRRAPFPIAVPVPIIIGGFGGGGFRGPGFGGRGFGGPGFGGRGFGGPGFGGRGFGGRGFGGRGFGGRGFGGRGIGGGRGGFGGFGGRGGRG